MSLILSEIHDQHLAVAEQMNNAQSRGIEARAERLEPARQGGVVVGHPARLVNTMGWPTVLVGVVVSAIT